MTETEEPSRPRRPQRPPPRPPKPEPVPTAILVPLLLALLSPLALAWARALSAEFGGGPNRCAMTYMSPAYFPVPVNASSTTYALWLYRERAASTLTAGGAMASVGNGGGTGCGSAIWRPGRSIPGIFVPGNAGSYRQVRSLASETARRVDARRAASGDAPDPEGTETREEHVGVDWFTLDFNEELSAFHGAVASRQTEFAAFAIEQVLARYPHGTPVIIAGHSMGGVVARAALLELNRATTRRTAVDATVVAIATPHEKSPAATQPAVARFYERTNRAWADERNADVTSRVAIVSVGGGDADRQVRPARAKPPTAWTNGMIGFRRKRFNVTHAVAGSIPGSTGVSADHRCVVWCQQIVVPIAETLLDVASDRRPDDAGGRVALARTRLGPTDEENQKNQTPQKPKPKGTARLDAAAALALDRSPSLVPIMLALAIDALVVPQTTRRGGFGVEGQTVRGAVSLFAAPVFVRSRVVLVFVLGGFIGGGMDPWGGTHDGVRGWAPLGVLRGVLSGVLSVPANLACAFAAYAFAAAALTLEALALDAVVRASAKIYVKYVRGPSHGRRRTTRRKVGDVTTVVDVSRRGFHVPFIATVTATFVSIWCPGAGVALALSSRLASAVRTASVGLGPHPIAPVDDFGEGDAARTCATLRLLLTCQSASMLAPSFVATVHALVNGSSGGEWTRLASFVPVARAGWEDVVLAVCTAAPAAFFAFAPSAYATLEVDWTSFNELPPAPGTAVSAAASSRAVRPGDLATLTGFVAAEAIALRAAAPGCAHWAQHAAAAVTVLPLLAGSAATAWSARGVFSGAPSRGGADDGRDGGSTGARGSGKPKAE